jgi:hypothetical protein
VAKRVSTVYTDKIKGLVITKKKAYKIVKFIVKSLVVDFQVSIHAAAALGDGSGAAAGQGGLQLAALALLGLLARALLLVRYRSQHRCRFPRLYIPQRLAELSEKVLHKSAKNDIIHVRVRIFHQSSPFSFICSYQGFSEEHTDNGYSGLLPCFETINWASALDMLSKSAFVLGSIFIGSSELVADKLRENRFAKMVSQKNEF